MPPTAFRAGQTVYLVESGHRIREAQVRGRSGGLYTVRFTDTGGGIRVRRDRLYPTRDAPAHPPRLLAQRADLAVLNPFPGRFQRNCDTIAKTLPGQLILRVGGGIVGAEISTREG